MYGEKRIRSHEITLDLLLPQGSIIIKTIGVCFILLLKQGRQCITECKGAEFLLSKKAQPRLGPTGKFVILTPEIARNEAFFWIFLEIIKNDI